MADKDNSHQASIGSRFGWIIVAACIVSQMIALGFSVNCFTLFVPDWSREFDTRVSELAIAITTFSMGAALVTPFIGVVVDKYPARWLFTGAMVGLAVFYLLISMADTTWQLLALYTLVLPVVAGFATAVPCQTIISRWFAGSPNLGLALGIGAMGLQMGGVVFPAAVAAGLPLYGWRTVFQIFGLLTLLVIAPLTFLIMRDPAWRTDSAAARPAQVAATPVTEAPVAALELTTRDILGNRNFWKLIAVLMPIQFAGLAFTLNLAPILADRGFELSTASSILITVSLAALFSKVASGMLADRFGHRLPLVAVAMVVATGIMVISLSGDNFVLFTFGSLLVGLGGGSWPLVASGVAAEFGTAGFGRAFGLIVTVITFSSFAPPIFAYSQEIVGSYFIGLTTMAALTLAGGIAALTLRRRSDPARLAS